MEKLANAQARHSALKRKAQDSLEDEIEEVVVPSVVKSQHQPLSTNSPFMADEIDGEMEEDLQPADEIQRMKFIGDVPCLFCTKRIPNPGKPGLYPVIGHLRALHDKETKWACNGRVGRNKCDYFTDRMDIFLQHYKKHL